MVNAKKKGNAGENKFANWLTSHGFKANRDSASGGALHKGDIVNSLDYSMEVKTVKKIGLLEAWRQVKQESVMSRNAPLLSIHFDGMPENEWLIVLHSDDWVELEKMARKEQAKPSPFSKTIDRDRAIEQIITAAKVLEG